MLIHNKRKKVNRKCNINMCNEDIVQVTQTKYLGVIIDKHFTFVNHAYYILQKVNKKIGFLKRIRNDIVYMTRVLIYKTLISQHFEYWRVILEVNKYTPIINMLDTLGFMSIEERLKYNICIMNHY